MIKFVILFRTPDDPDTFENTYNDFLALVERMPAIHRRQVALTLGSPLGQPPYYRILELYYESQAYLQASLLSPAGQEAGAELARFGAGNTEIFFCEVYEEAGGSSAAQRSSSTSQDKGQ